jgi:hypothetical protein
VSFLAPLYLALGAAIAVPLLIHLMRRRIGARIDFPAARYLLRAEKEHSRTLRIKNLLLMFLRVLAVLAIAFAAARPLAEWVGAGHAPTALAVVVDNSLSSSVVVNGHPLLAEFKSMVRDVLSSATSADRVWIVTIDGNVRGGSVALLRDEIDRMEAESGAGDPALALSRAAAVVRASGVAARQITLVTDGQRTEWQHIPPLADAQVVLYVPSGPSVVNRAVTLAEARPPRWTPRGEVAARFQSTDSTTYRITLNGRTFARGTAAPNEEVTVHASPPERGWLAGTVELEPDELAADNSRPFAVWIGSAPGVSVSPGAGQFLRNAIDVLKSSSRVVDGHDIAVVGANELATLPALIVAPSDPVQLGAANRALERLGIPWRFGARRSGEATARGPELDGVTSLARYELVAQTGAVADTLASVGQDAWIVAGARYVIVGSPISPDATNLPVRASFVPWLGGVLTERLVGEPGQVLTSEPGKHLPRPRWADGIETADGQRTPIGDALDVPDRTGTYFLTLNGRRVGALVVAPPPGESVLDRYSARDLAPSLRVNRVLVAPDAGAWASLSFRAAARRSLIEPALIAALLLLISETLVIRRRGALRQAA